MDGQAPSALLGDIVGIAICLALSALYSGTETTLTALSESKIHAVSERYPFARRWLMRWQNHSSRVLTALLVGNNLVNIAASVLAARIAYRELQHYAEAAAVGAMTFLLLVFGEVTPKTLAKRQAERYAPFAAFWAWVSDLIFMPASWTLQKFTTVLLYIIGAPLTRTRPSVTPDELEFLIELGQREGVLGKEHGELLSNVMEFRDTIAKEIMVPRTTLLAIESGSSLEEVLKVAGQSGKTRIPVYRENLDTIVGVLTVKDLLHTRAAAHGQPVDLRKLLRPVMFVPETQKILSILKEMRQRRMHLAIVVDEFGGTSGLVTLEDILEELVGDIRDEFDREENPLQKIKDGEYVVAARVSIHDLGEVIGVEIPDSGEYETLGGFVVSLYGDVPPPGKQLDWNHHRLTVLEGDARRVTRVRIERLPEPEPAEQTESIPA